MRSHLLIELRSQRDRALLEIGRALRIATLQAAGHRVQDIQAHLGLSPVEMKAARGRLKAAVDENDRPD